MASIELLIKKHRENFSLFNCKEAFRKAIKEQAHDSIMVAIIKSHVFQKADSSSHVYTICNRKDRGKNTLFIYDSCEIEIDEKVIQELYEGEILELALPNKVRQQEDETTCVAFAITDARLLTQKIYQAPKIIESRFDNIKTHIFELDKSFHYNALPIKKSLFNELIEHDFSKQYSHEPTRSISLTKKNSIVCISGFLIITLLSPLIYKLLNLINEPNTIPKMNN